jgi:colicin import membrane protein
VDSTQKHDALRPRQPGGMGRGLGLALLVHAGLLIAIAFGVNWRSSEPAGVEAELWAAVPQVAAPRPAEPEPRPEPKVEPRPPEPPPPPPKAQPVESQADAQIAIEKARRDEEKRKEQERRAEEEKRLKEQRQKEEQERREQERKEQERKEEERKLAETERKKKEAEAQRREQERLAAVREDQMRRIMSQAGATGDPSSTGTAARSAGPSASYAGRIIARLRPLSVFTDAVAGNPKAEVRIDVAPDGTILGRRLTKSSGVPAWDEAVLRAIDKAESLPRDVDGRVQNPTLIVWGPKD